MTHDCHFEAKINNMDNKLGEVSTDIKVLVSEFKAMNGKLVDCKEDVDKHVEESVVFRGNVIKHEQQLKDICSLKQWWQGAIITIFLGILSLAVIWGGLLVRVAHLERQNKIIAHRDNG